MAEQEACAQIVAAAAEEGAAGEPSVTGECPPQGPLPAPLVTEVRGALARLQGALRPGQGAHLLELVARLQAGLLSAGPPPQPPNYRRRDRKARHTVGVTKEELIDARKVVEDMNFPLQLGKNKTEKPAEEQPQSLPYAIQKQGSLGTVRQQEVAVGNEAGSSPVTALSPTTPLSPVVKNSTAQPFFRSDEASRDAKGFVYPKASIPSSLEDLVVLHSAPAVQQRQAPVKQTARVEASPVVNSTAKSKPILQGSMSLDRGSDSYMDDVAKIVQESLIKAAQKKNEVKTVTPDPGVASDEEVEAIKVNVLLRQKKPVQMETVSQPKVNGDHSPNRFSGSFKYSAPPAPPKQEFSPKQDFPPRQISRVKEIEQKLINGSANVDQAEIAPKSTNRFTNKKFRMKRANTIDIPKPLHCYQVESDDEGAMHGRDKEGMDEADPEKPKIPQFKPKTENDHKFLAFIQKHNNNDSNSLWSQNSPSGQRGGCNWSSCFGSIKNVFEGSTADNSRSSSANSAKKFWKTSDDSINFSKPSNFGPKLSKSGANYLNNLHDSKKRFKPPLYPEEKEEVVTGSLMVAAPSMMNGSLPERKLVKPIPKPAPVNQFSHAPMSAFKPLPKKTAVTSPISAYPPPAVWSPPSVSGKVKKLANTELTNAVQLTDSMKNGLDNHNYLATKPPTQKSPLGPSAPWAWTNSSKDNRVLNLAVNKFEKTHHDEVIPQPMHIPPYKEKNFNPVNAQNGNAPPVKRLSLPHALPPAGALSAPHLVQKLENLKQQYGKKEEEIEFPTKIDAERLQIEFYEKQIRQNSKYSKPSAVVPATRRFSEHLPSKDYTYTVTDYTPPSPVSTFVPLPRIPDIEEASPRPQKKLPDLVLNNLRQDSPKITSPVMSPNKIITNNVADLPKAPKFIKEDLKTPEKDVSDPLSQTEYKAVTKVMRGPVSQQAVIKSKNTQDTYEKRDTAAKSLKGVLQKFSSPKHDVISQIEKKKKSSPDKVHSSQTSNVIMNNVPKDYSQRSSQPRSHTALVKPSQAPSCSLNTHTSQVPYSSSANQSSHNKSSYVIPTIKYNTSRDSYGQAVRSPDASRTHNHTFSRGKPNNNQAYSSNSCEVNSNGESIVSSKLHFPHLNNMAFISPGNSSGSQTPSPTALSKSESWHQISQLHAMKPPSPRMSSPGSKIVSRAKSMHLLSVPKQFEAGITKEKINEKKKTVEAYFSGQVSPNQLSKSSSQHSLYESCEEQKHISYTPAKYQSKPKASAVNRNPTIEKVSTQNFSLGRSQTMPQMTYAELALLDESNVEDAFEDLFKSS